MMLNTSDNGYKFQIVHNDKLSDQISRQLVEAIFSGRYKPGDQLPTERDLAGLFEVSQVVGQTNYPECVLARELAICYATIGVVSNYAAGMQTRVSAKEVQSNIKKISQTISDLFSTLVRIY